MINFIAHRQVVIVGGGAAGAAAALAIDGTIPLMLDIGVDAAISPLPQQPVAALLSQARTDTELANLDRVLIGDLFQSVPRAEDHDLSIKLKAPYIRFITDRPSCMPADEYEGCTVTQSFAIGGLANAWGAGAMRYTQRELRHFPFPVAEIEAAFDALTRHIGISGSPTDELADYFGSTDGLLSELPLCELGIRFLARYERKKSWLKRRGLMIGRPRLAVLPEHYHGRKPFQAFGQEFFVAPHDGIYSPSFTIQELIRRRQLEYRRGIYVERFESQTNRIIIHARDVNTAEHLCFTGDQLILAAGTLNTARIVLASCGDYSTRLPLLDNPVTLLPFIDLGRIGYPLDPTAFLGAELILVLDSDGEGLPIQGSIYNLLGPLRTDMVREFPLSFSGNVAAARYLVPAMLMLQLFFPAYDRDSGNVQLLPSGGLRISSASKRFWDAERTVARSLRSIGYATTTLLARHLPAGSSIHYAGTIPARVMPAGHFETDQECRLQWAPRVTIADASTFPVLPAKNHTLMMMANAFRVGQLTQRRLASHP